MPNGYFIVAKNNEDEWDIKCSPYPGVKEEEIPKELKKLYTEVEEASSIIKTLNNISVDIKREYFAKLLSLAQVGLVGENPMPKFASEALSSLKKEICIKEGGRIKNYYMTILGVYSLLFILLCIYLLSILNNNKIYILDKYFIVFIGSMIGTWISFGARKLNLSFNELSMIEEDRLSPALRLLFIGICSCIIILFIDNDIVKISIGALSSENINSSVEIQLLIGIITGLIEYKIGVRIYNKAHDVLII